MCSPLVTKGVPVGLGPPGGCLDQGSEDLRAQSPAVQERVADGGGIVSCLFPCASAQFTAQ